MKRAGVSTLAFLFAGVCAWAQQISRVDGCLAVQGNQYVLVQTNQKYRLQGKEDELKRHVGELVRISGSVFRGNPGGLKVSGVEQLQPDCTLAPPPGYATDAMTGKVGSQQVAIPDTTTGTAGETTPGYQTETGKVQEPGRQTVPGTPPPQPNPNNRPGAPPDWEKAGQSPESANTMAQAAERAEIQPGAPLGTKPAAPESAGEHPQEKVPRTEAGTQQARTIQVNNGTCVPEKVTVRPGEPVVWVNNSRQTLHLAATGTETVTGENGSGAFASDVGPGKSFHQVFDRPGTYHYTCSVGKGQSKTGEIDVREE